MGIGGLAEHLSLMNALGPAAMAAAGRRQQFVTQGTLPANSVLCPDMGVAAP